MGFDKLLAPLGGKPVLRHSIEAFLAIPELNELILVTDQARFDACTEGLNLCQIKRVDGGSERHHSVSAGLAHVSDTSELIAVHDGARPLISPEQIQRCLDVAADQQAASSARRITETLKRADAQGRAAEPVDRTDLWAMETPQAFQASLLRAAYQKVLGEELLVTDEVSAVECLEIRTVLVENPLPNLKITFPQDLPLAEHLLGWKG